MNKVFLGLILAVCVLGMALVMLNDRLGRKPEPRPAPVAESARQTMRVPEEIAAQARDMELAEAALAPPAERERDGQAGTIPGRPDFKPEAPDMAEPAPKPAPAAPKPLPPAKTETAARPEPAIKPEPRPAAEPAARPEPPKTAAANPAAGEKSATKFVIYARDKGATVRMGGNARMDYSSMTLENPNRVVVDLAGDWKFPPNPGIPKNELVSAVRVGQNGDKTRLVIDLKLKPRKVLLVPFKNGTGVDVRLDR